MKLFRSVLIMPGNNPGHMKNCQLFDADAVIFDLEDAVIPQEKDAARQLVTNALGSGMFAGGRSDILVRINSMDTYGEEDIRAVVPCHPRMLLVPKVESKEEIAEAAELIRKHESDGNGEVTIMAIIETPVGLLHAFEIATASPRVVALSIGGEDYVSAVGARRTKEGEELSFARAAVVNAAAAGGRYAIDTPFTDIDDTEGLEKDTALARQLGFIGKIAINPRQIDSINRIFTPDAREIEWAGRVLRAIERANTEGSGVASLDGKMIDKPVVNRARRVLDTAENVRLTTERVS